MTHEIIRHLLDDYVSGDLADDARAAVAEHVAGCEMCRSEVDDLQSILAKAAELPKAIDPPAIAWQNIRASIEREKLAVAEHKPSRPRWWQRPSAMAAGLLLAAVLSSAATALYMQTRGERTTTRPVAASVATTAAAPATLAAFTVEENNYLRNVAVLQDMLDQQEASLAPETVAQLKASLRTIDEAILEARLALARDPANETLMQMLSGTYRQKVDLLRRTTELTRGS